MVKTMRKRCIYILLMVLALIQCKCVCRAQEQVLMEVQQKVDVYEKEDSKSAVIGVLEEGTPVICTEGDTEEWYRISYQKISGYVLRSELEPYGDIEEIKEEFNELQEDNDEHFQAIYEEQKQKQSDRVWGSIIGALILLMFVTGICTVQKNRKNEIETKDKKED